MTEDRKRIYDNFKNALADAFDEMEKDNPDLESAIRKLIWVCGWLGDLTVDIGR